MKTLLELRKDMPVAVGQNLWFQHDSCSTLLEYNIFDIFCCKELHWRELVCGFPFSSIQLLSLSQSVACILHFISLLSLILRRSRTGTVWLYTPTSNKRAARPKLYTESLTRDLKRMYSCFTLVRIYINL